MYKLKLILRYLVRRRITLVPILAVAVAVFLLIVVLAVMRGFGLFIEDKLRGTLADVVVESDDVRGFDGWEAIAARLEDIPGVAAVAPHLSGKGVLTIYGGAFSRAWDFPCQFIGIDPAAENSVTGLGRFVFEGRGFDAQGPVDRPLPGLILGNEVLGPYNIELGYPAALTTPTAFDEDSAMDFRVTSKFKTGLYEHDRTTVYVPLADAQKLLRLPGRVTSLHVRARDGADLARVKAGVLAALGDSRHLVVKTWRESQRVIIDAMALERIIWVVVLSALLAVAGFCVLAVMSLTVMQKRRDIGILRAVGASVPGILATWLQYGLIVGILGATLGLAGAWAFLCGVDAIEQRVMDGRAAVFYLWLAGCVALWPVVRLTVRWAAYLLVIVAWPLIFAAIPRWIFLPHLDPLWVILVAWPLGWAAGGLLVARFGPRKVPRGTLYAITFVLWSRALLLLFLSGHLTAVIAFGKDYLSWTPWPRDVFYFEKIPVAMSVTAMLSFWAWGVATAFVAGLWPAARAARTDPIRTLRIEH